MATGKVTMRAVVRKGGDRVFKDDFAVPSCGAQEVLVRVKAAAINPVDYKLRWPIIGTVVGKDFSGVIEELGAKVDNFKVGDEVYGMTGMSNGSLAELTVVKPEEIAVKPTSISFAEAAAMPITYLTSLQALRDYGKVEKNYRVLVIGASGGCGISAVQLARVLGAGDIVGICSGKNAEFVKSMGVTHVVDYTKEDIVSYCSGKDGDIEESMKFDVVYDAASASGAGEDYKAKSLQLLKKETPEKKHGQYVAINGNVLMWLRTFTIGHPKNQHLILAEANTKDLEHLADLVDTSEDMKVKPVIAELLPFTNENVEKGFTLLQSRRAVGKIVFDITKAD